MAQTAALHAARARIAGASAALRCSGTQRWRRSWWWPRTMTWRPLCRCVWPVCVGGWGVGVGALHTLRSLAMLVPLPPLPLLSICPAFVLVALSPQPGTPHAAESPGRDPPAVPPPPPPPAAVGPAQQRVAHSRVPRACQRRAGHVVVPPGLLLPALLRQRQPHHLLGRQRGCAVHCAAHAAHWDPSRLLLCPARAALAAHQHSAPGLGSNL